MESRDYWYLLGVTEELTGAAVKRLLACCGSPEAVFQAEALPLTDRQKKALESSRDRKDSLLKERDSYEKAGVRWCCPADPEYPGRLLAIPDPPAVLFYKGSLPPEREKTAGIVGARRCTLYGRDMAERLAGELAKDGVGIVSGMAMGIDGFAQTAALAEGGRSFAVLGCGPDMAYPAVNRRLYEQLAEQGGVISEYKPGTQPLPYHFPLRNRIISGLSDVLLVIEARAKSGSLITVDQALEQGKDVLALPGRVGDPLSEGCNQLIRQGAGILTGADCVRQLLGTEGGASPEKEPSGKAREKEEEAASVIKRAETLSSREKSIFRLLSRDPVHLEELMRKSGLSLGEISLSLLSLEEEGLIKPVSGGLYIKAF